MVQKRPFVEELSDVSSKHLRLEHGNQLVSFLEFPFQDVSQDPYTSDGKSCFSKRTTESDVKLESGKNTDFSMYMEKDIDILPGNNSNSSWPSSCESEEEMRSEAGHILFSQEYCSPARPRRTIVQPEDAYSYLLQCPPLKLVPVGPDFQADVPEWRGHDAKTVSMWSDFTEASTTSQASELNFKSTVEDEIKLVGHCIIPMPEIEPVSCNSDEVGSGRTDCFCKDPGSLRCVRQHIREARVNLWRTVGLERFLELGFGGMGEIVAEKWSDEDEQLFHDVVFSNPASLGKNFWDRLAIVFPSQTSDEIVSYYFNVFMLRKRAEQNRCTPMDIDSDNDEWEGSDESDEDEEPYQSEIHEDDSFDHIEGVEKAVLDYHDKIDYCGFKGMKNVSETWPMTLLNNSSSDSSPQPLEKTPEDERGAYDFQDDSCTTFDAVAVPQVSEVKVDDSKHWGSHEFILEPCDVRVWDAGYLTCPRTKADFLPTYSMIEEVFGVEAWEHEARDDGKSLS